MTVRVSLAPAHVGMHAAHGGEELLLVAHAELQALEDRARVGFEIDRDARQSGPRDPSRHALSVIDAAAVARHAAVVTHLDADAGQEAVDLRARLSERRVEARLRT